MYMYILATFTKMKLMIDRYTVPLSWVHIFDRLSILDRNSSKTSGKCNQVSTGPRYSYLSIIVSE